MHFLNSTILIDYGNITSIGKDDFALKKGYHYGTIFVSQENHYIISMILLKILEMLD